MLKGPVVLALSGLLVASASFAMAQDGVEGSVEAKNTTSSGMGLVCWAAMIELVAHFGKTCDQDMDPALRNELARSTATLRENLRTNGNVTEPELQVFLDRQAKHAVPDDQLCAEDDLREFYTGFVSNGPDELAQVTNEVLQLDGPPVWGTCL